MTDYNTPKAIIDCDTCTNSDLCKFYTHGVRAMLRCPSYSMKEGCQADHSAIANESTPFFNQPEGGDE